MATINAFLNCQTDCTSGTTYPALQADQSCILFEKKLSQVNRIYFRPAGATDAFDYTTPTAPATVSMSIDNTAGDNSKTIELPGVGEIGEHEAIVTEYHDRQQRITQRNYTLNFVIDNLSTEMYAFLQAVQCGDLNFTFRHSTIGDWIFGGANSITPDFVNVQFVYGSGRDDVEQATIILMWGADGDPHRAPNPYA